MSIPQEKLAFNEIFDQKYAFMSDEIVKTHAKRALKELSELVENQHPGTKLTHDSLRMLLCVLVNPEITETNCEQQLLYAQLLSNPSHSLTDLSNPQYDYDDDIAMYRKILQSLDSERYIAQALQVMRTLLDRSEPTNEWRDNLENHPDCLKSLQESISKCYERFLYDLKDGGFPIDKSPECKESICKAVTMNHRIYPALPALFVLSAINQVTSGSPSKSTLLTPKTQAHSLSSKAYDSFILSKAARRLLKRIENALVNNIDQYPTVKFPRKINKYSYPDSSSVTSKWISEMDYFDKHIHFAFPLCNTHQLAIDISSACLLTLEQAFELNKHLTEYLINNSYKEQQLRDTYGDQTTEIIKGFRKLLNPGTYYKQDTFINIYKTDIWSKLDVSAKSFFVDPYKSTNCLAIQLHKFIRKYIKFISLSKYLIFYCSPHRPLYGSSRIMPSYYRKLLESFEEYCEETFTNPQLQRTLLSSMGTSKTLTDIASLRPSTKIAIAQVLTPQSAINFICAHLDRAPKSKSALQKCLREFYQNHSLTSILPNENEWLAVYQFIMKCSLDIIGHCAVSLLADGRIQLLESSLVR